MLRAGVIALAACRKLLTEFGFSAVGVAQRRAVLIDEDAPECMICTGTIEVPTRPEPCRHLFCRSCLERWAGISNTCPLCKTRFLKAVCVADDGSVVKVTCS